MRPYLFLPVLIFLVHILHGQNKPINYYLGLSFGSSFPVGSFADTDINNPEAGFAKDGRRFDVYGGKPVSDRVTLTGIFRYQAFGTELNDLLSAFQEDNPDVDVTASADDWQAYYLLLGLGYRVNIGFGFSFSPRLGLGPMAIKNPGIMIHAPNGLIRQNYSRDSKNGFGLGYEAGIGLVRRFGQHFALMPSFTFSGGWVNIKDVTTMTDNVAITRDYQPSLHSFNLGLSIAYLFISNQ